MANPFDRAKLIDDLSLAMDHINLAMDLGNKLSKKTIQHIIFVACGAPNHAMFVTEYWGKKVARTLDFQRYFPAEFVHQNPVGLDQNTIVVLGSHSGTTQEIINAAQFLHDKSATTIAITQSDQSRLAHYSDYTLAYGEGDQGYYAGYVLLQSLISAILKEKDEWKIHDALITSLKALPENLADTFESHDLKALEIANRIKQEPNIYIVGAGPVYCTAYVIAVCILMEMQWIHAHPLVAAEFFHGPFEVMDASTPIINLLGEDPSRPEAERVGRFCEKISAPLITYDSTAFKMRGIDESIRPILAPFILDAALFRMAEHLASLRSHPLTTRRYMGKMEY